MFLRSRIQEVMLRERSRAVGSKRGLMSDATSLTSPTAASLLASSRLFYAISANVYPEDWEDVVSPTSTLEAPHFSARGNTFVSDRSTRKPLLSERTPKNPNEINREPKAVGLSLLDALGNEDPGKMPSMAENKMVVVGPQLKIRIPPVTPFSNFPTGPLSLESPHSPIEFGIKTRNSLFALNSPANRCGNLDSCIEVSSQAFMRNISPSEMELSEDYTRVILHGPNPRTIHIFDNCVIESFGEGCISSVNQKKCSDKHYLGSDGDELVSLCSACKKKLGEDDIFMHRGEKAFCSHECSCQEMLFDAEE